jgi:hypothetical protein
LNLRVAEVDDGVIILEKIDLVNACRWVRWVRNTKDNIKYKRVIADLERHSY